MRETYLVHHGIKGQKWGVRRFQNEDGSLTKRGASRYGVSTKKESSSSVGRSNGLSDKQKKAIKTTAVAVGVTAVAAIGAYKVGKAISNEKILMVGEQKIKDMRLANQALDKWENYYSVVEGPVSASGRVGGVTYKYKRDVSDGFLGSKTVASKSSYYNPKNISTKSAASHIISRKRSNYQAVHDAKKQAKYIQNLERAKANAKRYNAQQQYISDMIANTQSHVDPSKRRY